MKTFQNFAIDNAELEERRSLLPKTNQRVKSVKITRSSPAWLGLTIAAVLFIWWTWFVISDIVGFKGPTLGADGKKYYDFDEVRIYLFCSHGL